MNYESELSIFKRVLDLFVQEGWDCVTEKMQFEASGMRFRPDITLMKNGKTYGFIEIINNKVTKDKIEMLLKIISTYKPELFIITDGKSFEVYYQSEYVGTMTCPLNYEVFTKMNRLMMYAKSDRRRYGVIYSPKISPAYLCYNRHR